MSSSITNQRYKITNTTVKPLKTNARGEDIRPIKQRVGYGVQIQLTNPEEYVTLFSSGQSKIVDRLSEGVIKLHRRGDISVEIINDIADELRNFTAKPKVEEPVVESPKANKMLEETNSKSYPMGETHESGLVNPDGEPNFVAKAPKGGMSRQKK
jgi:hypothetical protein